MRGLRVPPEPSESRDHRDWKGHASGRELLLRLACDAVAAMGEGDQGRG